MLYAGIDIHKSVFQVVVLDPETGELSESRFQPSRVALDEWAVRWQGKLAAVAIEATTVWRWVARRLEEHRFEVHLIVPQRPRRELIEGLCSVDDAGHQGLPTRLTRLTSAAAEQRYAVTGAYAAATIRDARHPARLACHVDSPWLMAQATGLSPAEDEESWDVELRPALDAVPFERTWISDGVAYAAPSQVGTRLPL